MATTERWDGALAALAKAGDAVRGIELPPANDVEGFAERALAEQAQMRAVRLMWRAGAKVRTARALVSAMPEMTGGDHAGGDQGGGSRGGYRANLPAMATGFCPLMRLAKADRGREPCHAAGEDAQTVVHALDQTALIVSTGIAIETGKGETTMAARWTEVEDEQIRASARQGWPDLGTVARILGRTYGAVRVRAHLIGAVREFRQKAPLPPRFCLYCGLTMSAKGRAVCCSEVCKTLRGGHCAGCGRPWKQGAVCEHCARAGRQSRWPGRRPPAPETPFAPTYPVFAGRFATFRPVLHCPHDEFAKADHPGVGDPSAVERMRGPEGRRAHHRDSLRGRHSHHRVPGHRGQAESGRRRGRWHPAPRRRPTMPRPASFAT